MPRPFGAPFDGEEVTLKRGAADAHPGAELGLAQNTDPWYPDSTSPKTLFASRVHCVPQVAFSLEPQGCKPQGFMLQGLEPQGFQATGVTTIKAYTSSLGRLESLTSERTHHHFSSIRGLENQNVHCIMLVASRGH